MKPYTRLSADEREFISQEIAKGNTFAYIATQLGRHRSAISREVSSARCVGKPYRAFEAQRAAEARASSRHTVRKLDDEKTMVIRSREIGVAVVARANSTGTQTPLS